MRRSSECCLVLLTHIASYFLLVWLFADGTVHSFFLVMAFLCVLFFLFYFLGGNCVFFSTVCDCYTRGRQYTVESRSIVSRSIVFPHVPFEIFGPELSSI